MEIAGKAKEIAGKAKAASSSGMEAAGTGGSARRIGGRTAVAAGLAAVVGLSCLAAFFARPAQSTGLRVATRTTDVEEGAPPDLLAFLKQMDHMMSGPICDHSNPSYADPSFRHPTAALMGRLTTGASSVRAG